MCGICGELRFDSQAADITDLKKMMAGMARRGPDYGGSFCRGAVALGHQRLSIVDLSARSNQPLEDVELGLTLVLSGTIYNYGVLRRELADRGYRFASDGMAEVVLKAYHAWGDACTERLEGHFAFAIHDQRRHELFLARDRFGIQPLYISQNPHYFRFASTLPALLQGNDVDRDLGPVGLQYQFTLHGSVPSPHTVLKGIQKLSPATSLLVNAWGEQKAKTYWHLEACRPQMPLTEVEHIGLIREKLLSAVERQYRTADVPVGVLLSGGLDSSLLVGLLAELGEQDIPTFSIGFENQQEENGNEFFYSDLIARHFGTRHQHYLIPDSEILNHLPGTVGAMSEPMFSQDNVAFYLLAREVSKEVKVVLSGQGADEVFGGYFWYPLMNMASSTLSPLERFARHYFDRRYPEYEETLAPAYRVPDQVSQFVASRLEAPGADTFLDQVMRLDVTTLIVDDPVKRVDNMTMNWGLEARVPFLDHSLIETAMALAPEVRLRENGKFPLKHIARGLIPDAVIDRPKNYFPTPVLKYLRGNILEFIEGILNSQACHRRGLYNREYVNRLLAAPLAHFTPIQGNKLWHLALLEYWLQMHVDSPASF